MYTLIVRFVNLHKFKMPNGRVCSPLGFKQITFHPSLNILKRFSFLLFAYHPVVWWTITCVSVAAFLLICSHSARVSIWPFGFKMCIEPSLQHNLKKKIHIFIPRNTFNVVNFDANLPLMIYVLVATSNRMPMFWAFEPSWKITSFSWRRSSKRHYSRSDLIFLFYFFKENNLHI